MRREYLFRLAPPIMKRLNEVSEIIDRLHTPWQLTGNEPVDVNLCVHRALQKIITDESEDWVHLSLAEDLSPVNTTPDMLTEAFRVVIKNSVEAIAEKSGQRSQSEPRSLSIESSRSAAGETEVLIRDNGIGIKKEHLARIFEIRWTTKSHGLGFGLFWARDYIEGLGGKIHLESVWQQGTTTLITLPAAGQAQAS
jgi:signal transduction histidine kinase